MESISRLHTPVKGHELWPPPPNRKHILGEKRIPGIISQPILTGSVRFNFDNGRRNSGKVWSVARLHVVSWQMNAGCRGRTGEGGDEKRKRLIQICDPKRPFK